MNPLYLDRLNESLHQVLLSILNIQSGLKDLMPWFLLALCAVLTGGMLYLAQKLHKTQKKLGLLSAPDPQKPHPEEYYASLTKLPARLLLEKKIAQAMKHPPSALILISVDSLGNINDLHSYATGDLFLKHMALRLKRLLNPDDYLAHLNSNKFAVVLSNLPVESEQLRAYVQQVAKNLQKNLEAPFFNNDLALRSAVSMGITLIQATDKPVKEIIQQAHMALNQAKTYRHQNIQFFDKKLARLIRQTEILARDLPFAIERQQLAVYVHPQHDVQGQLVGVELLLRWHHPQLGMLSPECFIALAEKDHMINHLGFWMLDQAARFIEQYPIAKLSVSINVSPLQFHSAHFGKFTAYLLEHAPRLADRLIIEITEGALMENLQEAQKVMQALTHLGYRLSLDDFGMGFSNLAAISSFPLYEIKLDRSLVHNLAKEPQLRIIAQMIIKLAKTLQLHTVAEGVENKRDLEILTELGFDRVQGFYYSRPMPLEKWQDYLLQRGLTLPEPCHD